jgi:hypothetical protein
LIVHRLTCPRQHPVGPGLSHPVSSQLSTRPPGGGPGPAARGFPLPFGCQPSLLGHPVPPGFPPPLLSAYRTRTALAVPSRTHDAGLPRSTRVRPGPGRALSIPRGQRCSSTIEGSVAVACRFSTASPCHPGTTTQPGMFRSRGISKSFRIVALCRSFPSLVTAMVGTAALELSHRLRTRPIKNRPRTLRRGQVEHNP